MLLTVLIFLVNVRKNLNHSRLDQQQSLIRWMDWLLDTIDSQWCYTRIVATTPVKISSVPKWVEQNQSDHVWACHKQKNQQFFPQMNQGEKQELLSQIKSDYRDILLNYFSTDKNLQEKINKFINNVFYAHIPVPYIIEVHMELIDEFSTHLKLEGRSNETLLDYRLTLIDILAHLCEIYRAAVSK